MRNISRRAFLGSAVAAGAAAALPTGKVLGANSDIRLGFIGLGSRGSSLADSFSKMDGVRVVALAEPDREHLEAVKEKHPDAQAFTDLRELLEQPDIDAVVIAACVHWNAVAAVWAIEAGKHVFVEKPYSHNVWESRQVVEAARRHDRIVQVGTQHRSQQFQDELRAFLHSGELGQMRSVRAVTFQLNNRGPIGLRAEPMAPPPHVDYDLWLGGAQDLPIYRDRFQYDWHWVWNTGGGDVINWGAHTLDDVCNVVLRDPGEHPSACMAAGGRVLFNDAGETPNAFVCLYETSLVPMSYEVFHIPVSSDQEEPGALLGTRNGFVVEFEGGFYSGGRGGGAAFDNDRNEVARFSGGGDHFGNFITALREGRREILNAPVDTIHFSNSLGHLGNAALRAGGPYERQKAEEVARSHPSWARALAHFHQRLEANGVDPEADPNLRLSPLLGFDSASEQFAGPNATDTAQALLRREYRAPYVLAPQA